jgi:hypothetical protein
MNALVFVVTVMLNGVIQPNQLTLDATSDACVQEQLMLVGINRANTLADVDVRYFGECRSK